MSNFSDYYLVFTQYSTFSPIAQLSTLPQTFFAASSMMVLRRNFAFRRVFFNLDGVFAGRH